MLLNTLLILKSLLIWLRNTHTWTCLCACTCAHAHMNPDRNLQWISKKKSVFGKERKGLLPRESNEVVKSVGSEIRQPEFICQPTIY